MKRNLIRPVTYCLICLFTMLCLSSPLRAQQENKLHWLESYEQAVNQSQRTHKPILVLFTGSDWCGWCKKLEREVFESAEFAQRAGDAFVFLKLDFPMYARQSSSQKEQNEQLKKQYGVRGFPTVILLDEKQQKITSTGYQTGGGRKYADYLLKVVSDYTGYQQQQQRAASNALSPGELEKLYQQARELGQDDDLEQIITWGATSESPSFFLREHYLRLVADGLIESEEAATVRKQLLATDPDNRRGSHREVAIIEYQHRAEALEVDDQADAWSTCQPLLAYIERWGESDPDNLWRLQMTVAQTLMNRDHVEEALSYARSSRECAPLTMKASIEDAIEEMEQIQKAMSRVEPPIANPTGV